jgi:hypothetical protein
MFVRDFRANANITGLGFFGNSTDGAESRRGDNAHWM